MHKVKAAANVAAAKERDRLNAEFIELCARRHIAASPQVARIDAQLEAQPCGLFLPNPACM